MAAITLTPVDSTTAPVVVNTDIIYHVFTINGVTRVFFSKGGKSPYQVDVQESAASIAAASPNLVEVTTVNGAEYVFVGSGAAGPGLGIMFIDADGSGSKITFKYNEESGTTTIYSSDSPSVIAGRINALSPSPTPSGQFLTQTVSISAAQGSTLNSDPVTLIDAVAGKSIALVSAMVTANIGVTPHLNACLIGCTDSVVAANPPFAFIDSFIPGSSPSTFHASLVSIFPGAFSLFQFATPNQPVVLYSSADEASDYSYDITLAYYTF